MRLSGRAHEVHGAMADHLMDGNTDPKLTLSRRTFVKGVAPRPVRLARVEDAVRGMPYNG